MGPRLRGDDTSRDGRLPAVCLRIGLNQIARLEVGGMEDHLLARLLN